MQDQPWAAGTSVPTPAAGDLGAPALAGSSGARVGGRRQKELGCGEEARTGCRQTAQLLLSASELPVPSLFSHSAFAEDD